MAFTDRRTAAVEPAEIKQPGPSADMEDRTKQTFIPFDPLLFTPFLSLYPGQEAFPWLY